MIKYEAGWLPSGSCGRLFSSSSSRSGARWQNKVSRPPCQRSRRETFSRRLSETETRGVAALHFSKDVAAPMFDSHWDETRHSYSTVSGLLRRAANRSSSGICRRRGVAALWLWGHGSWNTEHDVCFISHAYERTSERNTRRSRQVCLLSDWREILIKLQILLSIHFTS